MTRLVLAWLASAVLAACGARSGLRVPCRIPLERAVPQVVFVDDRTVAAPRFDTPRYPLEPRFMIQPELVADAVARVAPALDGLAAAGVYVYPLTTIAARAAAPPCAIPAGFLVPIAQNAGATIGAAMRDLESMDLPEGAAWARRLTENSAGGSPQTWSALRLVAAALSPDEPAVLVLLMGGSGECAGVRDSATCDCVERVTCDAVRFTTACPAVEATLAEIARLRDAGIPSLAVASDQSRPFNPQDYYMAVARAGGLPRAGPRPDYAAADPDAVRAGLLAAVLSRARCQLHVRDPSRTAGLTFKLHVTGDAGGAIARDQARRDGWDWTDEARGRVQVFGPACDAVVGADARLELSSQEAACVE